ncbi:uncharacterized protein ACRADG_008844 [Cochliomyia hominivorax]
MSSNHKLYIEKYLIPEIISQLDQEELVSFKVENSAGLDGFMSNLFNIQLKTKSPKGEKEHLLIAKFMRGDVAFRESSKSYIQFANEIYIYATVLPYYDKFLKELNIQDIKILELVPPTYKAEFGYIEGLSSSPKEREAALVMENIKPLGYQLGPRLILHRNHLLAMCKPLGQYHAMSYALRALNNSQLERLKAGIIVLPFINEQDPNDANNNLYRVLYRYSFDRLFEFYDRKFKSNTFDKKSAKDLKLIECMQRLRDKYFEEPTRLMERLRTKVEDNEEDRKFAAILHGDYNRNNVLFKYKTSGHKDGKGDEEQLVEDMKMIDFQELRYGSPCLDLSFFMYFNTSPEERYEIWGSLLKTYHDSMFSTLTKVLKASQKTKNEIEEILHHYSFEKFQSHFSRFAFYGVMICSHFLPWILCSEDECERISKSFENDLYGDEFRELSLKSGGDEVNMQLLAAIRHACQMGYMDDLPVLIKEKVYLFSLSFCFKKNVSKMSAKLESFIRTKLIKEIVKQLHNEELLEFTLENSASLNGFMSCIYTIKLKTKTQEGVKERSLIVKFMRGDQTFRLSSKSYIQYHNEIYTYSTVLPRYDKLLKDLQIEQINIKDLVAPCYMAKYGFIEGLSCSPDNQEACLVLENLSPLGYQMGPRLVLSKDLLLSMCKPIAQFHALSYALRVLNPLQFKHLREGIITFPFLNENDPEENKKSAYRVMHRYAFDRFFEFYDLKLKENFFDLSSPKDLKLMEDLKRLKEKYFDNPTRMQENLRTKILDNKFDEKFAVILHGDYNRNNVLFKFKENDQGERFVADVKMLDFQQLRFGSPALDLSFFMYLNCSHKELYENFPNLLHSYHNSLYSTLSLILQSSQKSSLVIEEILSDYNFENFQKHFRRFAFYGVMVCLHFLPWMLCSEEECSRISELFASDIHGQEFRHLSLKAGGDEVNMVLMQLVRHASEMGYMEDL